MRDVPETIFSAGPLRGDICVPGDKSISHRALMLAAACDGPVTIANLNPGRDVSATALALAALGTDVEYGEPTQVRGAPLHAPSHTIDCMNSGTTARLLMGICAGARIRAQFDGDASLRRRPMEPVAAQLRAFGARIETANGLLPVTVDPAAAAETTNFILVTPSAQIKSALLLCAVYARQSISISGDRGSRDHTERMLRSMGAQITFDGKRVDYSAGLLHARDIRIPGDFSAAAFFMVAATVAENSDICIRDVGINPGRTGLLDALLQMGAAIELTNRRMWNEEPVADIRVRSARLRGIAVGPDLALRAIDEIPVLAVAAARAAGQTRITGIKELRNKESDRIAAIGRILATVDVSVEALPNGIEIAGGPDGSGSGTVRTEGDHRTAMSVAALAAAAGPLGIDDAGEIDVSFPGFIETMAKAQE